METKHRKKKNAWVRLAHIYSIHMDVNFQETEGTDSEILRRLFPVGGLLIGVLKVGWVLIQ